MPAEDPPWDGPSNALTCTHKITNTLCYLVLRRSEKGYVLQDVAHGVHRVHCTAAKMSVKPQGWLTVLH